VTTLNAIIKSTRLGKEDHGIPTFNLTLQLSDGMHQGFGGWDLRHPPYHDLIFRIIFTVGC